jgi:hypothetical protein
MFANGTQDDCLIGSIILTLCSRKYQICDFLRVYKGYECYPIVHPLSKMKFVIAFKEADLKEYLTVLPEREKTRHYLSTVCKFPIRRQYNTLFETSCDDYKISLWYHWLYFASKSPVWLDRIEDFGGTIDDEKMEVKFPNDDLIDAFYDNWGLEPDEQSKEINEKLIGNYEVQLSIDDFCKSYGAGNQCSPVTPPLLVNSIQITN